MQKGRLMAALLCVVRKNYFFAWAKRLLTSSQLMTSHQAARYSGRRLLYLR
jgi:hypothetical protein